MNASAASLNSSTQRRDTYVERQRTGLPRGSGWRYSHTCLTHTHTHGQINIDAAASVHWSAIDIPARDCGASVSQTVPTSKSFMNPVALKTTLSRTRTRYAVQTPVPPFMNRDGMLYAVMAIMVADGSRWPWRNARTQTRCSLLPKRCRSYGAAITHSPREPAVSPLPPASSPSSPAQAQGSPPGDAPCGRSSAATSHPWVSCAS